MAEKDRYAFRPVALCSVLALGCALLIWCGLQQVMMLDGARLALGVVLLIAAGLLFVAAYLLGHAAVIIDSQGVRVREIAGDWREIRWAEVTEVTLRAEPRSGRTGGSAMFVIRSRGGATIQVIRNERTQAMLRRYSPVPIPE